MPQELTLAELTGLLRECAGADETDRLDQDVLDTTFTSLGYDSLAMLQTTGRIERDYQLALDEESVSTAETPRQLLALVNAALSSGAASA